MSEESMLRDAFKDFESNGLTKEDYSRYTDSDITIDTCGYYGIAEMMDKFRALKKKHKLVNVKRSYTADIFSYGYIYRMRIKK